MWFVVLGVLLLILKVADFGSVANWSWWIVLSPFPLAIVQNLCLLHIHAMRTAFFSNFACRRRRPQDVFGYPGDVI